MGGWDLSTYLDFVGECDFSIERSRGEKNPMFDKASHIHSIQHVHHQTVTEFHVPNAVHIRYCKKGIFQTIPQVTIEAKK